MNITVPPDVTARIVVPPHFGGGVATIRVTESGTLLWDGGHAAADNVRAAPSVESGRDAVEIIVGSGTWHFVAE